jgi:hypothetical protein
MYSEGDAWQEQEGDGAGGQGMERAPGGRSCNRLRGPQRQAPDSASQGTVGTSLPSLPPFLHNKMRGAPNPQ